MTHSYYFDNLTRRYLRVEDEPYGTYTLVGVPTEVYQAVVMDTGPANETLFKRVVVTPQFLTQCCSPVKKSEARTSAKRLVDQPPLLREWSVIHNKAKQFFGGKA